MALLALTYPWLSGARSTSPNLPPPPRRLLHTRSHPPSPSQSQSPSPSPDFGYSDSEHSRAHQPLSEPHRAHLDVGEDRSASAARVAHLNAPDAPDSDRRSSDCSPVGRQSLQQAPVCPLEPPRPSCAGGAPGGPPVAVGGRLRHSSLPAAEAVSTRGARLAWRMRGLRMGRTKRQPAYSDLRADENRDNKVPVYADEAFASGISFKAKVCSLSAFRTASIAFRLTCHL